MKKYFQEVSTGNCYVKIDEISNGIILTKFDDRTGTPISNSGYKRFVTKEELKSNFNPYNFKFDTDELQERTIAQLLQEIVSEIRNHGGCEEESIRNLEEFMSPDLYREMVKDDDMDTDDFIDQHGGNDDYYFEEAKQSASMIHAFVPLLKKAFVEYSDNLGVQR